MADALPLQHSCGNKAFGAGRASSQDSGERDRFGLAFDRLGTLACNLPILSFSQHRFDWCTVEWWRGYIRRRCNAERQHSMRENAGTDCCRVRRSKCGTKAESLTPSPLRSSLPDLVDSRLLPVVVHPASLFCSIIFLPAAQLQIIYTLALFDVMNDVHASSISHRHCIARLDS